MTIRPATAHVLYQDLFRDGEWSLKILSHMAPSISATATNHVLVGARSQAILVFCLPLAEIATIGRASKEDSAEDIITHLLSKVKIHFETTFVKRFLEPTISPLVADIHFPEAINTHEVSFNPTPWSWEEEVPQLSTKSSLSVTENVKNHTEIRSSMIRFIKYFPFFIGRCVLIDQILKMVYP
jgi:hypothetical protein